MRRILMASLLAISLVQAGPVAGETALGLCSNQMNRLVELDAKVIAGERCDSIDSAFVRDVFAKANLRVAMTNEQSRRFWRVIGFAASGGDNELLNSLLAVALDSQANTALREKALLSVGRVKRAKDQADFRLLASSGGAPEDVRIAALQALTLAAEEQSEVFLKQFVQSETNQHLVAYAREYAKVIDKVSIARDISVAWPKRREAMKYLTENMVPSFALKVVEEVRKADALHADEVRQLQRSGVTNIKRQLRERSSEERLEMRE